MECVLTGANDVASADTAGTLNSPVELAGMCNLYTSKPEPVVKKYDITLHTSTDESAANEAATIGVHITANSVYTPIANPRLRPDTDASIKKSRAVSPGRASQLITVADKRDLNVAVDTGNDAGIGGSQQFVYWTMFTFDRDNFEDCYDTSTAMSALADHTDCRVKLLPSGTQQPHVLDSSTVAGTRLSNLDRELTSLAGAEYTR
ncbi:MAG: hypothetical protein J07HQX50_02235 [Haloquadratum sp. J07HQX50]|jgi:hypothetical protein|nr:MAG: hypothetical protein J07HQX50_02235 [Haloquadratum sp. J07HQX50]